MNFITNNIKWVMLISGVLTSTLFYAVIAPEAALMFTFGESISGPIAEIVVRNWGALITMIGILLIYGAFRPDYRPLILIMAIVSKAIFIGLVLSFGRQYLATAGLTIAFDTVVVLIFVAYLATSTQTKR